MPEHGRDADVQLDSAGAAVAADARTSGVPAESASREGEPAGSDDQAKRLESLLSYVPDAQPANAQPAGERLPAGLRSAELVELGSPGASVRLRGMTFSVEAVVAKEVDMAFLENARREGQRVLVEIEPGHAPVIVGVLQTRLPDQVRIEARIIEIDAKESLTLRSGRAGLRLRKDGDVELIGTRISATSRGLMRLVGRVLRLN